MINTPPFIKEDEPEQEPTIESNGPTKQFWGIHSISTKKKPGNIESTAPKTPKDLVERVRVEREREKFKVMKEKAENPKIARAPKIKKTGNKSTPFYPLTVRGNVDD